MTTIRAAQASVNGIVRCKKIRRRKKPAGIPRRVIQASACLRQADIPSAIGRLQACPSDQA